MIEGDKATLYKLAQEEYNLLEARNRTSEDLFIKWENTYLVANGFMITITGTVISKDLSSIKIVIIAFFIAAIGILLCYQWARIMGRALPYIQIRQQRQALIEKYLRRKVENFDEDYIIFDVTNATNALFKSIVKPSWRTKNSTFVLRGQLPIFFIGIWVFVLVSLFYYSLFYLL